MPGHDEESVASPRDWFVPLSETTPAGPHWYGFPHAGGGVATLATLAEQARPATLWALNLPGRQARFGEPSCTDLGALVDALARELATVGHPVRLVGYCAGSLLAFLVARRLRHLGAPAPAALVAISYPAPDRAQIARTLHQLPGEEFWREIVSYGGVPAQVAAQPDFREIFEPPLRADYQLLSGYRHVEEPPLEVPLTIVVGDHDPVLSPEEIDGWRRHAAPPGEVRGVPGGHWLLDEAPVALAAVLGQAATGAAGTTTASGGAR